MKKWLPDCHSMTWLRYDVIDVWLAASTWFVRSHRVTGALNSYVEVV
jgi:hypothetical protein